MSDERSQNSTNSTCSRARKAGPLPQESRARKQAKFLKTYRETANIKYSCQKAGINRQTFYDWRDNDEAFKAQLPDAKEDANESLEMMAFEQAAGILEPAVSMGRIVYEEVPDLDEEGKPKLDKHGQPLYKRGKMLMVRKYSPSVLITLLKANMPEKYKDRVTNEHTGKNGGPIQTQQVEIYKVRIPDNGRDDTGG